MPDGEGKEFLENGDVYRGNFSNGLKDGEGQMIFKDGSIYKGSFHKGLFHGKGSLENAQMRYSGEWKNGKKHG